VNHTYLLLPRLKVHNANALSSAVTIGFPAITAWLGFIHALERKVIAAGFEKIKFSGVGICCHDFNILTYRGRGDFVSSIVGIGNPLDKNGDRQSFIEEPRCHLTVSLIIKVEGDTGWAMDDILEQMPGIVTKMKVAGGDILDFEMPSVIPMNDIAGHQKALRKLMPGYVLIERRELLVDAMAQGANALDGLLDYLTVKHRCEQDDDDSATWTSKRKTVGWIVPIATGFQGVTPLAESGETKNVRDNTVPHRFAEAVVTLGEFVMPHRFRSMEDIMWQYQYEPENNLYLCVQNKSLNMMKEK
jgi:CRISPR-associated protein Csy2